MKEGKWVLVIAAVLVVIGVMTFIMMRPGYTGIPEKYRTSMNIKSDAFDDLGDIPPKYTCDGDDISPQIMIEDVPDGTMSFALVVHDPDSPSGDFVHWLLWNIPSSATVISEGVAPSGTEEGRNDFGKNSYGGPCPGFGKHRYSFDLYALDTIIDIPSSSGMNDLKRAMEGHILGVAEMIGKYERQK